MPACFRFSGFGLLGFGFLGFRVSGFSGLGCGVWGLGFGVWGVGFGVWGLWLDLGLGFRVQGVGRTSCATPGGFRSLMVPVNIVRGGGEAVGQLGHDEPASG